MESELIKLLKGDIERNEQFLENEVPKLSGDLKEETINYCNVNIITSKAMLHSLEKTDK